MSLTTIGVDTPAGEEGGLSTGERKQVATCSLGTMCTMVMSVACAHIVLIHQDWLWEVAMVLGSRGSLGGAGVLMPHWHRGQAGVRGLAREYTPNTDYPCMCHYHDSGPFNAPC